MRLLLTSIIILYLGICPLWALVPKEELFFNDLTPQAEQMIVFRPYDGKHYRIRLGIGCLPALFDDLSKNTKIYVVKLGDLLAPYNNGDIGLIYIETEYHKVRCKIVDIKAD